jgi:hypothetical protein
MGSDGALLGPNAFWATLSFALRTKNSQVPKQMTSRQPSTAKATSCEKMHATVLVAESAQQQ